MILGPRYADPTNNGTARGWLTDVDEAPVGSLDACFQGCVREFEDGNFHVIELELGAVAFCVLMVAHGHKVLGHETVLKVVGADAMARIRAEGWLLNAARAAMNATMAMIDGRLLESLETPADVIPAYRRNIEHLATLLALQEVEA